MDLEILNERWVLDYKREHGENCPRCEGKLLFGPRAEQELAKKGWVFPRIIAYCPKCENIVLRPLRPEDYGFEEEWKKSTEGWQHKL